jgi:hypothetical protein
MDFIYSDKLSLFGNKLPRAHWYNSAVFAHPTMIVKGKKKNQTHPRTGYEGREGVKVKVKFTLEQATKGQRV